MKNGQHLSVLERLASRDLVWVKPLRHPELFGITPAVLRFLEEAEAQGGEARSISPTEHGFEIRFAWGHRSLRFDVTSGLLWESAGSWPAIGSLDRALADVAGGQVHAREVLRRDGTVEVLVGVDTRDHGSSAFKALSLLTAEYADAVRERLESDGYGDLCRELIRCRLVVPPIPEDLRGRMRKLEDWRWSTLAEDDQPAAMDDYLMHDDWLLGAVPDHVTLGHAGHGLNSYALTLRLAVGPLALRVQEAWGGAFGSPEDSGAFAELMTRVDRLLSGLERRGVTCGGTRARNVVVEVSPLRGLFRCQVWDRPTRTWREASVNPKDPWSDIERYVETALIEP